MEANYLGRLGTQSLDNMKGFPVFGEKAERHRIAVKLRKMYETVSAFFNTKFESNWEKQTGLPWKEWGSLERRSK